VENAVGYSCFLTNSSDVRTDAVATDNGDGTWSVQIPSGLAKDTYYLRIKPIPAGDIYREIVFKDIMIAGIMMTSQYSFVYYYQSNITVSGY
jgi:hypothetical protein